MKSRLFPDSPFNYTPNWTIWSSKFQKFSGEGLTEPPPQTPPPALSRASPSIRASPDSDPPTFEAWLRPCWIMIGRFRSAASWSEDSKTQPPPPPLPKIGQFQHCMQLPNICVFWCSDNLDLKTNMNYRWTLLVVDEVIQIQNGKDVKTEKMEGWRRPSNDQWIVVLPPRRMKSSSLVGIIDVVWCSWSLSWFAAGNHMGLILVSPIETCCKLAKL